MKGWIINTFHTQLGHCGVEAAMLSSSGCDSATRQCWQNQAKGWLRAAAAGLYLGATLVTGSQPRLNSRTTYSETQNT